MNSVRAKVGPILLAVTACAATAGAADFDGNWKLDVARSKPDLDLAAETMTIERTGSQSSRTTIDIVTRSGEKNRQVISRVYDRKEHPVTGSGFRAEGVTEICVRLDALTRRVTQKRNGKVNSELTSTLSADGKVMTIVRKGQGAETLVLLRQ